MEEVNRLFDGEFRQMANLRQVMGSLGGRLKELPLSGEDITEQIGKATDDLVGEIGAVGEAVEEVMVQLDRTRGVMESQADLRALKNDRAAIEAEKGDLTSDRPVGKRVSQDVF